LIYYIVIRVYTGRKDSTFLPFWLIIGIVYTALGCLIPFLPEWIQEYSWIIIAVPFVVLFFEAIIICSGMLQVPDQGMRFIIILGAQVRGKTVSDSLKRRLDKACDYMIKNPNCIAILTGGQGKGEEITEAEAMYRYLSERGILKERLIREKTSTSTWENLKNSQAFIQDLSQPIGIVTNNFHVYRSVFIASKQGYKNAQGISAPSNAVLFPNYLVRECFACMKLWLVDHKK